MVIVFCVFFLGWFARGYMTRARPDELAKWDKAGNDAKSAVSSEASAAADRIRAQYDKS